jgi:hypothetical protein
MAVYENASSTPSTTFTVTATAEPTNDLFLLASNNAGTANQFATDQVGVTAICGGFTGTQSSQFQTILNTYMSAVGANVY